MRNALAHLQSSPWREVLLTFVSIFLGIFAGPILQLIAPPLFETANLPYITFALVAILFLVSAIYSLTMWRTTNQKIETLKQHTGLLADAVGHQVRILPYEEGYEVLKRHLSTAQTEIRILSNYVFDWQNGKPIYDLERLQSSRRKKTYSALQSKLNQEKRKGKEFRFVKIVQIPPGHKLDEVFPYDPVYYEDCLFLAELGQTMPEFASLRASDIIAPNTFSLVDRSFFYLELEIHNPDTGEVSAPFVMVVEGVDSEVIRDFLTLHQRIEANSRLVTKLDSNA